MANDFNNENSEIGGGEDDEMMMREPLKLLDY
jgi:hypothetical protein